MLLFRSRVVFAAVTAGAVFAGQPYCHAGDRPAGPGIANRPPLEEVPAFLRPLFPLLGDGPDQLWPKPKRGARGNAGDGNGNGNHGNNNGNGNVGGNNGNNNAGNNNGNNNNGFGYGNNTYGDGHGNNN